MKAFIRMYEPGDNFLESVREAMMPRDHHARRSISPSAPLSHFVHGVKARLGIKVEAETTVEEAAALLADRQMGF